ncbi:MAG: hypothetical protein J6R68_02940 [Clostridia bacterium]|nr:hypothetical protein [Clostridia bacterium]
MSKICPKYGKAIYADCLECDDKLCTKTYKYKKIIIGIDQSYQRTGISIAADGKLKKVSSIDLSIYESNSQKRSVLHNLLCCIIEKNISKAKEVVCVIERIRLRSKGFLNIDYIKSIGALNSVIVDVFNKYGISTYSVDTRCWKAQVIGTSKPSKTPNKFGVPNEKWPTVKWAIKMGFEDDLLIEIKGKKKKDTFVRNNKKYMYNTDAADSAAIALFGFLGEKSKLQLEK